MNVLQKHNWQWYFRDINQDNVLLLINFKKHLQVKGLKNETIFDYQKEMSRLMKYLEEKDIKTLEVSTDAIQEYLDSMDCSNARKIRIISVLSVFYKHNFKKKYCKENPIKNIDRNKYK